MKLVAFDHGQVRLAQIGRYGGRGEAELVLFMFVLVGRGVDVLDEYVLLFG